MSLVDYDLFAPVFAPFVQHTVGFMPLDGNVGDRLIDLAARQLMTEHGVSHRDIREDELARGKLDTKFDAILISGGGNMGSLYPVTVRQRQRALDFGLPVTVLPQTFTDSDEDIRRFDNVYVRERTSLRRMPGTILAPDLALGLRSPWIDEGIEAGTGVWLREDEESRLPDRALSLGDPAQISTNVEDYLGLASKFERIVTDRLHFAIAGLLLRRRVTLLPNSYHKNRSVYETWLRDLGCQWRSGLGGVRSEREDLVNRLWRRFAAPPTVHLPWKQTPRLDDSWELKTTPDEGTLRSDTGETVELNPTAALVLSLCDGVWTTEDMCLALAEQYEQPVLEIAKNVQAVLMSFRQQGALVIPEPATPEQGRQKGPAVKRQKIDLEVLPIRKVKGRLRWSAHVKNTRHGDLLHYFECDSRWRGALTRRADPFVLAVVTRAMRDGADLRVTGAPVDSLLLENLDEFQQAWHSWRPDAMRPVAIEAREVDVVDQRDRPAVALYSGGVDSSYTLFRHCVEPDGRRNRRLEAVVMAHGFDISVNDRRGFESAMERLRPVADGAGVDLIDVATNVRTYFPDWELEHGPPLASVMSLFGGRFGAGLIPSTAPYRNIFPWGSNPVTDHLLGGAFRILHDSAAVMRFEKMRALARWPDAITRLRVCWLNRDASQNCGNCIKCFHLATGLQALRAPLTCFVKPPEGEVIANYFASAKPGRLEKLDLSCTLDEATIAGVDEPWVNALHDLLGPSV